MSRVDRVDVPYPAVAADPSKTVRQICETAGLAWDEPTEATTSTRVAERRARHGVHRYRPEDFGFYPDEVRERFSVYRERFDVS